jgi:hypothetical protein
MLVSEYFIIVALQNNGYEKVHHDEGHEKLKDRKKDVTELGAAAEKPVSLNVFVTLIL